MPTQIKIQQNDLAFTELQLQDKMLIDIKDIRSVLITESLENLYVEIVNDKDLVIFFDAGEQLTIENYVDAIKEESSDTPTLTLEFNGESLEVSSFEKLLELMDTTASNRDIKSQNYLTFEEEGNQTANLESDTQESTRERNEIFSTNTEERRSSANNASSVSESSSDQEVVHDRTPYEIADLPTKNITLAFDFNSFYDFTEENSHIQALAKGSLAAAYEAQKSIDEDIYSSISHAETVSTESVSYANEYHDNLLAYQNQSESYRDLAQQYLEDVTAFLDSLVEKRALALENLDSEYVNIIDEQLSHFQNEKKDIENKIADLDEKYAESTELNDEALSLITESSALRDAIEDQTDLIVENSKDDVAQQINKLHDALNKIDGSIEDQIDLANSSETREQEANESEIETIVAQSKISTNDNTTLSQAEEKAALSLSEAQSYVDAANLEFQKAQELLELAQQTLANANDAHADAIRSRYQATHAGENTTVQNDAVELTASQVQETEALLSQAQDAFDAAKLEKEDAQKQLDDAVLLDDQIEKETDQIVDDAYDNAKDSLSQTNDSQVQTDSAQANMESKEVDVGSISLHSLKEAVSNLSINNISTLSSAEAVLSQKRTEFDTYKQSVEALHQSAKNYLDEANENLQQAQLSAQQAQDAYDKAEAANEDSLAQYATLQSAKSALNVAVSEVQTAEASMQKATEAMASLETNKNELQSLGEQIETISDGWVTTLAQALSDLKVETEEISALAQDKINTIEGLSEAPSVELLESAQTLQNDTHVKAMSMSGALEELQRLLAINDEGETTITINGVETTIDLQELIIDSNLIIENALEISENDDPISVLSETDDSNNSVSEAIAAGAYTGVHLNAVDIDGQQVSYSLADDLPFIIDDEGKIFTKSELNFQDASSYTFEVTATSSDGTTSTKEVTVNVSDINNDLTFVSERAGYKNVVGFYELNENGEPINPATIVIDDQNGLKSGEHLANLNPNGNYGFFIIAGYNAASLVDESSVVEFDSNGQLSIDGNSSNAMVFHTNPQWNSDGRDHFIYESDGQGGTNIKIEDLKNLGDKDFDDVVLNVNFKMADPTKITVDLEALDSQRIVDEEAHAQAGIYERDGEYYQLQTQAVTTKVEVDPIYTVETEIVDKAHINTRKVKEFLVDEGSTSVTIDFQHFGYSGSTGSKSDKAFITFLDKDVNEVGTAQQSAFKSNGKNSVTFNNDVEFDSITLTTNSEGFTVQAINSDRFTEVKGKSLDTDAMEKEGIVEENGKYYQTLDTVAMKTSPNYKEVETNDVPFSIEGKTLNKSDQETFALDTSTKSVTIEFEEFKGSSSEKVLIQFLDKEGDVVGSANQSAFANEGKHAIEFNNDIAFSAVRISSPDQSLDIQELRGEGIGLKTMIDEEANSEAGIYYKTGPDIIQQGESFSNLGNKGTNVRKDAAPIDKETQTFDFGVEKAFQIVTISFDAVAKGGWENDTTNTVDTFEVIANGQILKTYTFKDGGDVDSDDTGFEVQLDKDGKLILDFEVESTAKSEVVAVDNLEITLPGTGYFKDEKMEEEVEISVDPIMKDVIETGEMDDTFEIIELGESEEVDAGEGFDTLIIEEDMNWDFDSLDPTKFQNIEAIDLTNNSNEELTNVDYSDVLKMTDEDNILKIIGNEGDKLGLTDDRDGGAWTKTGEKVTSEDGETFDVWQNDDVQLFVDEDIIVTDV